MKTLLLTATVLLLLCNSAFAIDQPISAQAPEDGREVSTSNADDGVRSTGLDLSNIPQSLRWLVIFAHMLTNKTVFAPDSH